MAVKVRTFNVVAWVLTAVLMWASGARATSPPMVAAAYTLVPQDGTFRSGTSLSRYETAALISRRLYQAATLGRSQVAVLRDQVQEYRLELAQMGVQVANLQEAAHAWRVTRQGRSLQDLASWSTDERWFADRMSEVDAFWTDPSSPLMRLAMVADDGGRAALFPPRPISVDLLGAWNRPPAENDFILSSMADGLPRRRLRGALAVASLAVPGLSGTGAGSERMGNVTAMRLPTGFSSTTRSLTDPVDLPYAQPTPFTLPSPVVERVAERHASPLAVRSNLFGDTASAHWSATDLTFYRDLRLNATYESSRLGVRNNFPYGPASLETGTASLLSRDFLGASNQDFARYSTDVGYQLPTRGLHLNLKLDELSTHTALSPTSPNLRSSGLDLRLQNARLNLDYAVTPNLNLEGGYAYSRTTGQYVPGMSSTGLSVPNVSLSDERAYPYLGFDYKVNKSTRLNLNVRFYNTLDFTNGSTRGPNLNFNDPSVTTEVKVTF